MKVIYEPGDQLSVADPDNPSNGLVVTVYSVMVDEWEGTVYHMTDGSSWTEAEVSPSMVKGIPHTCPQCGAEFCE